MVMQIVVFCQEISAVESSRSFTERTAAFQFPEGYSNTLDTPVIVYLHESSTSKYNFYEFDIFHIF